MFNTPIGDSLTTPGIESCENKPSSRGVLLHPDRLSVPYRTYPFRIYVLMPRLYR